MGNPRHCTTNLLKAHHSSLRYSMGVCHITELQPHHTQNFIQSVYPITMATLHYLPPVKPSAIALGVVFTQASAAAVLTPLFGDTYNRAKAADSKEEFFKSRETATALLLGDLLSSAPVFKLMVSLLCSMPLVL